MVTKLPRACDLFKYLGGDTDWAGQKRPGSDLKRGELKKASRLVEAVSRFALLDRASRVEFFRRECLHVMHSFVETKEQVDPLIPAVIRGTEDLLLAGMRRDALSFVACYHPQEKQGHVHIVVPLHLLPRGGRYIPRLSDPEARRDGREGELTKSHSLLARYAHLCNIKFGTADPMDPDRTRLLHPYQASGKPELKGWVDAIEDYAWGLYEQDRLCGATFPEALRLINVQPLAAYDENGRPLWHKGPPGKTWPYRQALVVQCPKGEIVLGGMLVKPDFIPEIYRQEVDRRRELVRYFDRCGEEYYQRFLHLIGRRARRQSQLYPGAGLLEERVGPQDFAWLQPEPKIVISISIDMPSPEKLPPPVQRGAGSAQAAEQESKRPRPGSEPAGGDPPPAPAKRSGRKRKEGKEAEPDPGAPQPAPPPPPDL